MMAVILWQTNFSIDIHTIGLIEFVVAFTGILAVCLIVG